MGILLHPTRGVRYAHGIEQLAHALVNSPSGGHRRVPVPHHRLGDLLTDAHDGIQRGHGLLENHGDSAPAHAAHGGLGQAQEIATLEAHFPAHDAAASRQQSQ